MIDTSSLRLPWASRRRRLSRARRVSTATRTQLQAGLARVGFHGLMVAVGLLTAVTVWNGAAERARLQQAATSQADFDLVLYGAEMDAEPVESLASTDVQ